MRIITDKKTYWSLQIFDGKYSKFGGHWQFLSKLTGYRILYLDFSILKKFDFEYFDFYYDGYHRGINIGCFQIGWGM